VPRLGKIVVIVFENRDSQEVVRSRAAPFFDELARRYAELTDYDAIDHPSLPNYLGLISGSTHGIENDCAAASSTRRTSSTSWELRARAGRRISKACHDRASPACGGTATARR
jgi:hypothetical protein